MTELDLKMQELRRQIDGMRAQMVKDSETIEWQKKQMADILQQMAEKDAVIDECSRWTAHRDNGIAAISEHYGIYMQTVVAMEEMAELIKELSKAIRGKGSLEAIAEEIADVQVMLWQMVLLHLPGMAYEIIEGKAIAKIDRQIERIRAEQ